MAGPGDILIKIGAETASAIGEMAKFKTALDSSASASTRMKAGIQAAAIPAAAALTALAAAGYKAAEASIAHQAVDERLETSLRSTTGATEDQAKAMAEYVQHLELATGVSEEQLAPALALLARASGSTSEAQKELNIAMDVSAATGKDLTVVSTALAKAHDGNFGSLKRLVPGLDQAALKSKDLDAVLQNLSDTTGGAMVASTKTAEGQMQIFHASTKQLNEALGAGLLPIIQAIIPLLTRLAVFASDNAKAIQILAGVVAVLSAGILAANIALKAYEAIQVAVKAATIAWTAVQWLLNAALDANPIGVITLAIAALVAGIIIAYKHSQTFRDIVHAALTAVEAAARSLASGFEELFTAAKTAFDWIVAHWQVAAFAFGPIGAAIALIADNWATVAGAAKAAADAMLGTINSVIGALRSAIGAVEDLIGALSRIHVPHISLPSIPNPFTVAYPGGPAVASYGAATASSSSGSSTTINVYGAIDPEGTARTIRRVLAEHDRRMGRTA